MVRDIKISRNILKITALLPVVSQPRYHKRIRGLKAAGAHVSCFYFERPYFEGASPPCEAKKLGRIEHGVYSRRFFQFVRAIGRIRRDTSKDDVVYAFGLDMALLALFAGFNKHSLLIYEVGDLRPVQFQRGLKGAIVRSLERLVLRKAYQVIVTASGFAEGYYFRRYETDYRQVRVIENKLDFPGLERPYPEIYHNSKPIVIGYFGLLRCARSWETLKALARQGAGLIHIVVRGYPLGIDVQGDAAKEPYISYGGEFVAPDDLASMYAGVDLVWGCYPVPENSSEGNWRWARTNRFYESCFFRRPMIALAGTDEASEVISRNIGMALDLSVPEESASRLLATLPEALTKWQYAAIEVPDWVCTYQDEHTRLVNDIEQRLRE